MEERPRIPLALRPVMTRTEIVLTLAFALTAITAYKLGYTAGSIDTRIAQDTTRADEHVDVYVRGFNAANARLERAARTAALAAEVDEISVADVVPMRARENRDTGSVA